MRFANTYQFCNYDISKCILLLGKGVYQQEYIDYQEIYNEISLSGKEDFYSHLNMEDVNDADYAHAKRICKDFE